MRIQSEDPNNVQGPRKWKSQTFVGVISGHTTSPLCIRSENVLSRKTLKLFFLFSELETLKRKISVF